MTNPPIGVLVFAGSLRKGSFNKKVAKIVADLARSEGAKVTHIDLRDFPLPLYDADLEEAEGIPANAMMLKELFKSHESVVLCCPEYNSSIPGILKNALDWVSRSAPGEKPLECFDRKVISLTSASPGALGGLRGLVAIRSMLTNIKAFVLPEQVAISKANEAFDQNDQFKEAKNQEAILKLVRGHMQIASKLRA